MALPAATIELLLAHAPTSGGAPIGYEDWALKVELATSTNGMWGTYAWGESEWSGGWTWHDLTPQVLGAEWTRGQPNVQDRPRAGVATLALELPANGDLAPWLNLRWPYLDEGALIRISAWSPAHSVPFPVLGYRPQFVGTVETLEEQPIEMDAKRMIVVTLVEPTYGDLALIDGIAHAPAFAGDTIQVRLNRLFALSDFRLSTETTGATPNTLQATDLSMNRLAEVLLTVDSGDNHLIQTKYGTAQVIDKPTGPGAGTIIDDSNHFAMLGEHTELIDWPASPLYTWVLPYLAAPIVRNEAERISAVQYSRVGGTVQTVTGDRGRGGPRVATRSDLLNQNDADVLALATATLDRLTDAAKTLTVTTDAHMDDRLFELAMNVEYGDSLPVWRELSRHSTVDDYVMRGYVLQMTHKIGHFRADRVAWESEYLIAVTSALPGPPTAP